MKVHVYHFLGTTRTQKLLCFCCWSCRFVSIRLISGETWMFELWVKVRWRNTNWPRLLQPHFVVPSIRSSWILSPFPTGVLLPPCGRLLELHTLQLNEWIHPWSPSINKIAGPTPSVQHIYRLYANLICSPSPLIGLCWSLTSWSMIAILLKYWNCICHVCIWLLCAHVPVLWIILWAEQATTFYQIFYWERNLSEQPPACSYRA